ncbi:MAG: hypothetical protein ABGZ49_03785 [Akkermansiaceae bacterium]
MIVARRVKTCSGTIIQSTPLPERDLVHPNIELDCKVADPNSLGSTPRSIYLLSSPSPGSCPPPPFAGTGADWKIRPPACKPWLAIRDSRKHGPAHNSNPASAAPRSHLIAVPLSDKEALRIAYTHYASEDRAPDLKLPGKALDHPGGDLLPGWLHENFEALTLNKETEPFSLK